MTGAEGRWNVVSETGFMSYYDATFADAYRSAARLTQGDRPAAEDVVHDAYVGLFDMARRGAVSDVGVGWIVTAVRRRYVDTVRSEERAQRRLRLTASSDVDQGGLDESDGNDLLDGLSERERAALVLRFVEGLPVGDVAELLDTSVRATESLLQRAKRKSRERSR